MTDEIPTGTNEAATLPGGLITDETWAEFEAVTVAALGAMIDGGESADFTGQPLTKEAALDFLRGWLTENKGTLAEASVEFAKSLVNQLALVDEPPQTPEEFEAGLASLSDEQLTQLSEMEAAHAAELRAAVIDRRRALLASALEVGNTLLRGALASGLQVLLARV